MKQCDEEIHYNTILRSDEISIIIQKANHDFKRREDEDIHIITNMREKPYFYDEKQEAQKNEDQKLITVFEKIFGGSDNSEDLDLICMLKSLRERRGILEAERLLYGQLTAEQEQELRAINALKYFER